MHPFYSNPSVTVEVANLGFVAAGPLRVLGGSWRLSAWLYSSLTRRGGLSPGFGV